MPELYTSRLCVKSFTLEFIRAALTSRAALSQLLNVHVPEEWPGPDLAEILPLIAEWVAEDASRAEWGGLVIHTTDQRLIGDIGFKGGPDDDGSVEIGYSIIPAYRGQGYATEAARAMMDWAFGQPGVSRILAECHSQNLASIRVLEKLGMCRLGSVKTHEGTMLHWELRKCEL